MQTHEDVLKDWPAQMHGLKADFWRVACSRTAQDVYLESVPWQGDEAMLCLVCMPSSHDSPPFNPSSYW